MNPFLFSFFTSATLSTSFFLFSFSLPLFAQEGIRYITPATPAYDYLDYLVNSGQTIPQFALRQPWEMDRDLTWNSKDPVQSFLKAYWDQFYKSGRAALYVEGSERLKQDDHFFGRFQSAGGVFYTSDHITLANRIEVDQDYKRDPLFAGDLSESENWIYGRINEAYINLNAGGFDLFFGRTHRNWGPVGEYSLILSGHPYTYDHLLLSYTTGRIKLSLIYALLDTRDALVNNPGDSVYIAVDDARRHLVGHRLDFRLTDRLQFGFTEMATYGGENRAFEPAFMNPVNFYYPLQRNDRKLMSGFWAVDMFFKPLQNYTVYGQFLIDDIIVNNDPGEDDRAKYPDRFGLTVSLRAAGLAGEHSNINLTYTRIWNRTYQSRYTYENYHYRGLGLGYPCAACEEVKLKVSLWNWFPLWMTSETIYGRYGSVSATDVFPLKHEEFPIPPVQNNLFSRLDVNYELDPGFRMFFSGQYLHHQEHYLNRIGDREKWTFSLGLKLIMSTRVGVE